MRTCTRTRMTTSIAAVLLVAACSTASLPALAQGTGFPAEHPLLAGFEHVTTGDGESPLLSNPLDMLAPYWALEPTFEGRQGIETSLRREGDVAVVEMVLTGLLDDAVSAERYRGVSSPVPGGWFHGELGRQVKCRRGPTPDEWTTGPCP